MWTGLQRWFPIGILRATSPIALKTFSIGASAYLSKPWHWLHVGERDGIGARRIIRNSEAEFLAATVINLARMIGCRDLNVATENLYAVEPVSSRFTDQNGLLLASFFVQSDNSVEAPIGDVHPILMNGDGKRMTDKPRIHRPYIRAVQVRVLYVIQQSVAPVQSILVKVDRQTVRPT